MSDSDRLLEPAEQMANLQSLCNNMVGLLDSTFNSAIETKEKQFLYAYKDHITQVQADIDALKKEADETEDGSKHNL